MDKKFFKIGLAVLLIFSIVYVGTLVSWVFTPLVVLARTLFVPILLAGFFYYLLRPLVQFLSKKLPKTIAILLVYLLVFILLVVVGVIIGPSLQRQLVSLTEQMPQIAVDIQRLIERFLASDWFASLQLNQFIAVDQLIMQLTGVINQFGTLIAGNIASFVGALANLVLILFIVPFILFYILKDGHLLTEKVIGGFKGAQKKEVIAILKDIDETLSSYIQGQGIVCLCVGTLCFVTYLIVGLEYALLLGLIAGITNVIPYLGPWLGAIPAVIVALFQSPIKALVVLIIIVVIQQIESNLIAPQVIGKKMKIHPITIMFLLLTAGRLIGLIGMIIAVPTFAVSKVLVTRGVKLWRLWRIKHEPLEPNSSDTEE